MGNLHRVATRSIRQGKLNRKFRSVAAVLAFVALQGLSGRDVCAQRRAPPAAAPPTEDYDVVFFGPQGAVFLRLQIDAGKKSVTAIRRAYSGTLFRVLDLDADARLNEAEAREIPVSAQRSPAGETLGEQWGTLDVAPQDGAVSEEELFTFVDGKLGPRFRVEAKAPRLQQTVQLNGELDTDGDELISRAEIEEGLLVLHPFDFDDDETLSVAELQPFPTAILQAQQQAQVNRPTELAVTGLQTPEQRALVLSRVQNLYGNSGSTEDAATEGVPGDCIGMKPEAVRESDKDGDGRLNPAELSALLESPAPILELPVNVPRNQVTPPRRFRPTTLAEVRPANPDAPRTTLRDIRAELRLAGMDVNVRAINDIQAGISNAELTRSFYLQKVREVDTDKNGYLNEAEFAALAVPAAEFAGVDSDRDGMVVRDELNGYLEQYVAISQAALVLTISDDAKTLFEILDENIDNRLSAREFHPDVMRWKKYDANGDGRIARAEMRSYYGLEISLARANLLNVSLTDPAMMQQSRQGRVSPATAGPTWFRKMDRNQDGDLTWREFLGERADFARIDANQDGLIDVNEAVAAE